MSIRDRAKQPIRWKYRRRQPIRKPVFNRTSIDEAPFLFVFLITEKIWFPVISKNGTLLFYRSCDEVKNILYYSYDKKRHEANNKETIRRLKEHIAKLEKK